MSLIRNYIQGFISRAGSSIFFASLLSRGFSFLASWIALQMISNKELGVVLFAFNIISFIIPLSGFGLYQSYIRFAAISDSLKEKEQIFNYVLKKGTSISFLITFLIIGICSQIEFNFKNTFVYISLLSFIILPSFFLEMIRAKLRLQHNNKLFAKSEVIQSLILILTVFTLTYFFKENGYLISLLITPILVCIFFNKHLLTKNKLPTIDLKFDFWKYGFFASLSNVVTQLLFIVDILLIGYLLNDAEMVTQYRYISLIPFSLLFLPRVFMTTDFIYFTENIKNVNYIKNYIKSYMLLFSCISIFILVFCYFFSAEILEIFDPSFVKHVDSFFYLIAGVCGIFIFRGLFGNLLSSIGKAHVNFYITSIALILNLVSNYYLIPKYGIKGAAITTACLMWITGVLSLLCFWHLYRKAFRKKVF